MICVLHNQNAPSICYLELPRMPKYQVFKKLPCKRDRNEVMGPLSVQQYKGKLLTNLAIR